MLNQLTCPIKNFTHIIHVADVHVRLTQRHTEYEEIFQKFYSKVKNTPSNSLIALCGDLYHNKSDLSPECVDSVKDFLFYCSELRPTVLIAGNHDATLTNKNRMDSLTPIVRALKHPNLFYLRDTGLYGIGDILFNNMSVFSDPSEYITYDKIPKIYKNQFVHHIALYHGPVNGVLTDLGFYMVNKAMPVEIFDGHHIVLLGDIHKKQDLQHFDDANGKPAVHYPGSMIQQNHSETIDDHGFSLWDLTTKTYEHTNIPNDYGFFTVEVNQGKLVTDLTKIPKKARVHVKCFESVASEVKAAVATIKGASSVDEVTYTRVESVDDPAKLKVQTNIVLADIADVTYQNKLLTDFLKDKCKVTDQSIIDSVLTINTTLNGKVDKDNFARNLRWKPKKFEFDNMFSYGETNVVDFTKCKNVMGLFGPNACGKSSIFSALSFCLFDKFDRGYKAVDILNVQKTSFRCKFNFEINGVDFFIERKAKMDRKGNVKVDVQFWKEENSVKTELNGEERSDTNRLIREKLGTYEDFVLTALSVQSGKNISSFFDMNQSDRKDLLSQFIGLVIFDKLLDLASPELKSLNDKLKDYKKADLELKLQNSQNELSSLTSVYNDESEQVEGFKDVREGVNNDILEETKKLLPIDGKEIDVNIVKKRISNREEELKKYREGVSVAKEKISKVEQSVVELDKEIGLLDNRDLTASFKHYQTKKSELAHVDQIIERKKAEVTNKINKKKILDTHEYDPNCKYCVNNEFVKDARKIAGELENDKITYKQLLEQQAELKKEVEEFTWVIDAQEKFSTLLRKRNEEKDTLSRFNQNLKTVENSITNIESELVSLNKDVEDYNKQMEIIESNRYVQTAIDQLKMELKNLDFKIDQKNKNIITMSGRMGYLQNTIKETADAIEKIKLLEKKLESYTLYIKAVNRDGLPYMVISNTVPEVEREVNNILNQMVEFHLSIETDGKNVTPYIVYDDKKWPIEMASGFERFISSLAIRVALINISNLPRPNFLVVDEGFGVIDSNNMASVQTLLQFLKVNFDFLVVVSHLDVMRDMVDKHIEVKKDNGFSSVNFV